MQIHKLLIPATTFRHKYPDGHPFGVGGVGGPWNEETQSCDPVPDVFGDGTVEMKSDAETITCIVQPVAFATTITFAGDEQILVLNLGYGHSISAVCYKQSPDSASIEVFRYEYLSKDAWDMHQLKIIEGIGGALVHPAIYAQHKELIDSFVAKYIF